MKTTTEEYFSLKEPNPFPPTSNRVNHVDWGQSEKLDTMQRDSFANLLCV